MLALTGTLKGSLVGVPAYSLQGVQSCVTESELLLPSLQRGYVDILSTATEGSSTMNGGDFGTSPRIAEECGVCASSLKVPVGKSGSVCVGVEVSVCVCMCMYACVCEACPHAEVFF